MANEISTSTSSLATAYPAGPLVAVASNGTALVVWFDGTNVKWSYASSPYSSWTTATLISSVGGGPRWQAGLYNDLAGTNAQVVLVCADAAGDMVSYCFTLSGTTYSVGSANTVESGASEYDGGSVALAKDGQGRYWAAWQNNSDVIQVYYSSNGTSWTASTTFAMVGGGAPNLVQLAYIGNYIVCIGCMSGGGGSFQYARVDAHSATIGSWSSPSTISNGYGSNTSYSTAVLGVPGSNYGVMVYDGYYVQAQYYDAATDTWASWVELGGTGDGTGGTTSDRYNTLVTDGTNIWCVYCAYDASNNYSLVFRKFTVSTLTWDSTSTQLEASGNNIIWPTAAIGDSLLAFTYTQGTASPWTVYFDTYSFGGGTVNGGGTFVSNSDLDETSAKIAGSANVQASSEMSASALVEAQARLVSNSDISTSAQVATSGNPVSNSAISTSAQVATSASLVSSSMISAAAQIVTSGILVSNSVLENEGVSGGGVFASNSALSVSAQVITAASLQSNSVAVIHAQVGTLATLASNAGLLQLAASLVGSADLISNSVLYGSTTPPPPPIYRPVTAHGPTGTVVAFAVDGSVTATPVDDFTASY